ncbi:helix-turn-helix domain-containing protein [Rhizobium leguminosarum]|uniref:helix-turn-helix domain-containing protein n=1 Tax=Rhizobium leguminosarum TaxID=384 RepID=UPI001C955245|nr:helix-turn-helix transcriptional regulator [Rhizobium leguminosarum]MBY5585340.1 helix-turn-helix domain-containing protein [Rhizobium leguminosarum]
MDHSSITGRQLAAARTLAEMSQADVARAANVSVPTLKRMEGASGAVPGMTNNVAAVVRALEAAGVTFIDGDYSGSGGPGVRLTQHLMKDAPPGAGD